MLSRLLKVVGLSLGLVVAVQAASPQSAYPSLRDAKSPALQKQLEKRLKRLNLDGAVRRGDLAVALVDVTDPQHPSLAQVNGDEMMYAASLPKIAILLAAFERIHDGKLQLNNENRELMTNMIRYSSNTAATQMIRRVGPEYINTVLRSPKYRLYDTRYNGGLWVGKEYASGVAFQRDPLHNLSHGATAIQVARFYYLLETGQLVSPELSKEMKAIMGDPGIHHKFVKGLLEASPDAQIYRKSGSWRNWHADSAIVEHAGRTYIAVALAESPKGGDWLKSLICELDGIILQQPVRTASLEVKRAGVLR
ncbi:MAG: class A beta-lactamase-related serine hydrolase [Gammaproteobacteria bacterium]|nr:class A beta-lactamase-related serine hydrolase [Gammaproteobacteria bacterium]MBU2479335.1 class A beta-lactamase-related serine hydrolase [Gammaproteobacteria bacterium]